MTIAAHQTVRKENNPFCVYFPSEKANSPGGFALDFPPAAAAAASYQQQAANKIIK
jgi:hypothetical protein